MFSLHSWGWRWIGKGEDGKQDGKQPETWDRCKDGWFNLGVFVFVLVSGQLEWSFLKTEQELKYYCPFEEIYKDRVSAWALNFDITEQAGTLPLLFHTTVLPSPSVSVKLLLILQDPFKRPFRNSLHPHLSSQSSLFVFLLHHLWHSKVSCSHGRQINLLKINSRKSFSQIKFTKSQLRKPICLKQIFLLVCDLSLRSSLKGRNLVWFMPAPPAKLSILLGVLKGLVDA